MVWTSTCFGGAAGLGVVWARAGSETARLRAVTANVRIGPPVGWGMRPQTAGRSVVRVKSTMSEDRPASPAATELLVERGTPQVGPARFDGVSPQFFGALVELGSVAFASSLRKTKD